MIRLHDLIELVVNEDLRVAQAIDDLSHVPPRIRFVFDPLLLGDCGWGSARKATHVLGVLRQVPIGVILKGVLAAPFPVPLSHLPKCIVGKDFPGSFWVWIFTSRKGDGLLICTNSHIRVGDRLERTGCVVGERRDITLLIRVFLHFRPMNLVIDPESRHS